ncbi:MAG TPA: cytidylate kinase-like family protein [bacterium]|nr:cytidylate kinase-like family protein [bacterium]
MPNINQLVNRQINLWNAERVAFDKRRQEETTLRAERPADLKPVVTISRERGCRGKQLAKLLSRELQYGLFDRQIINYLSEQPTLRRNVIESLDEQNRSDLELWIEGMLARQITDHDDYIRGLIEVVKTTALQGGVVILGRGANYILSETSAYRVRTVAPLELRVRNMMDAEGMSEKQAREEIKK